MALIHREDKPPRNEGRISEGGLTGCYLVDEEKKICQWQEPKRRPAGWFYVAEYEGPASKPTKLFALDPHRKVPDNLFDITRPSTPEQTPVNLSVTPATPSTQRILSNPVHQNPAQPPLPALHLVPNPSSQQAGTTSSASQQAQSQAQQNPVTQQSTTVMAAVKPAEIRMGQPAAFNGDRAKTTTFLAACRNHTFINSEIYKDDDKKIAYVLSFMTEGQAAEWANDFITKAMEASTPSYGTWKDFETKFKEAFNPYSSKGDALDQLTILRMKNGVEEYISTFRLLVTKSGLTDLEVISRYFIAGLNPALARNLASSTSEFKDMDTYYKVAARLDAQYQRTVALFGNRQPNHNNNGGGNRSKNIRQITGDNDEGNGQTIRKLTSGERDKLMKEGKCFRCRKPGHWSFEKDKCEFGGKDVRQITITEDTRNDDGPTIAKLTTMLGGLSAEDKEVFVKNMMEQGF